MRLLLLFSLALTPLTMPLRGQTPDVELIIGGLMPSEGGHWKASESPLENPFGVDFDAEGNMYIVELEGGRVHRLDTAGKLTRIAGDGSKGYLGDAGPATDAVFNGMHNCVVAGGNQLLISDSWNHCVRRLNLGEGTIDTIAGTGEAGFSGDGGVARSAKFDYVMCIALSSDGNTLHIVDLKNRRIRNVDLKTNLVATVAGNGEKGVPPDGAVATNSPLVDPRAADSDAEGNLYILERGGHALRVVRPDGSIETVAGSGEKGFRDAPGRQAQFGAPKHICTDPAGNVYIADDLNGAIRKYDPATRQVTTLLGRGFGHADICLSHPHGVRYHDGHLYVVDSGNSRILRLAVD